MKTKLFTEYVDNVFIKIEKLFPYVYKNRSIKQEFVDNPFSKYFILFDKEDIIGFLNFTHMYEKIEIVNINILDSYKGKGYSKLLMNSLLNYKEENNVENITLEVNKENSIAINLYKSYGFKEVGIRKRYYNGIDGILMERK